MALNHKNIKKILLFTVFLLSGGIYFIYPHLVHYFVRQEITAYLSFYGLHLQHLEKVKYKGNEVYLENLEFSKFDKSFQGKVKEAFLVVNKKKKIVKEAALKNLEISFSNLRGKALSLAPSEITPLLDFLLSLETLTLTRACLTGMAAFPLGLELYKDTPKSLKAQVHSPLFQTLSCHLQKTSQNFIFHFEGSIPQILTSSFKVSPLKGDIILPLRNTLQETWTLQLESFLTPPPDYKKRNLPKMKKPLPNTLLFEGKMTSLLPYRALFQIPNILNILASTTPGKATYEGELTIKPHNLLEYVDFLQNFPLTEISLSGTIAFFLDLSIFSSPKVAIKKGFLSLNTPELLLQGVKLKGIQTSLSFKPGPVPSTFPSQTFSISSIDLDDLRAGPVTGLFNLKLFPQKGEDMLEIKSLHSFIEEGNVRLHNLKGNPFQENPRKIFGDFSFENIDIEKVWKPLRPEQYKLQGIFSGKGKFQWNSKGFFITQASSNSDRGLLTYHFPKTSLNKESEILFSLFKNFYFTHFHLTLETLDQEKRQNKASIILEGFNPKVLKGHPFIFNIKTTGKLNDLITQALGNLATPSNLLSSRETSILAGDPHDLQ